MPPAADPVTRAWNWSLGWIHRIENRLFPAPAGPSSNPSGLLAPTLAEAPALLVAFAIGLVAVALLENAMRAMPVPAGGDPGQWLSTSYAYVGMPYPSWILPGQYPPLLFPLLGSIVVLAGGPISGALTYVGVIAVLNGISIYFLARSVTRHRSAALLAEALVLLNPTFLSMLFWGFYPNLLGFVFMNLSLGLFVRFIRSRRPLHLYLFWVCGAATVLTHTLVGVVLVAVAGLFFLSAIGFKLLPREFYRSRAGLAGAGTFVGAVGGFYLATALFTVPHPQYFQSGAFAYVRNGTASIFNLLVRPFAHGIKVSPASSVTLLWVFCTLLILYVVGLRLFWKSRVTLGVLLTVAMALGPLLLPAIGWEMAVVTDYSRFSYFLVAPIGLGVAVGLDWYLTKVGFRRAFPSTVRASVAAPERHWARDRSRAGAAPGTVVLTMFVVVLVGVSGFVAAASLPRDEKQTTQLGHDPNFLKALQLVRGTGVPGSLLTVPGVAKWTRALLDRDAYFPNVEARFTFDPAHLIDEEQAYFALTSRYVADNGQVAATALGTNLTDGNDTFEYQPSYYGSFTPVLTLPLGPVSVGVAHAGVTTMEGINVGGIVKLHPVGPMSFSLTYVERGFNLTVTLVVAPNTPQASFRILAT
ncbi:MAG TPA: glycosyltransferase family 39 protein, partial [Thermoplasmata archaeon]|nr:glycosyltransferase family 39 protein [Thermoplasmata archaeon]